MGVVDLRLLIVDSFVEMDSELCGECLDFVADVVCDLLLEITQQLMNVESLVIITSTLSARTFGA